MTMEIAYLVIGVTGGTILILMIVLAYCVARNQRAQRAAHAHAVAPSHAPPPLRPRRMAWPSRDDVGIDLDELESGYGFPPELMVSEPHPLGLHYGEDCTICHDVMDGRATIGKIGSCKHAFHRDCITRWYRTLISSGAAPSCPICREQNPSQLIITKVINTGPPR